MRSDPKKVSGKKRLISTGAILSGAFILLFAAVSIFYFFPQRSESFESPPVTDVELEAEKEEPGNVEEKDEGYETIKEKQKVASRENLKDPFNPDPLIAEHEPEPQPDPDEDPEAVPEPEPEPEAEPEEFTTYTVQPCDTLYSISRHFGVPVDVIAVDNDIVDKDAIYPGEELIIRLGEEVDEVLEDPKDMPVTK